MKTTRIHCGTWSINNTDVELATELFGPSGTQADRRWFYRLLDGPEWRRKGRNTDMSVVLYFRNSVDATFFALKKAG
jgi:hypothetical protein